MSTIIRGTTPTITFHITSEIDLSTFTEVWFTIADLKSDIEQTFKLSDGDVAIDSEAQTLSVQLTQENTLQFQSAVNVQIRALDDSGLAYATNIIGVSLADILKNGVIE